MSSKKHTANRLLSGFLALLMALSVLPFGAVSASAQEDGFGAVTALVPGGVLEGDTVVFRNTELNWSPADPAAGRSIDGWWIGIRVEAPEGMSEADLEDAKREIAYGLGQADVVKISDNEVVFMTGEEDYEKAAQTLKEQYQIPLLFVTLGRDGSRAYYKDIRVEAAGFIQANTIETTGAGDTFTGCVLSKILENGGIENLTELQLKEMLVFANAGASLITTRRGALKVMPEEKEILDFLSGR